MRIVAEITKEVPGGVDFYDIGSPRPEAILEKAKMRFFLDEIRLKGEKNNERKSQMK